MSIIASSPYCMQSVHLYVYVSLDLCVRMTMVGHAKMFKECYCVCVTEFLAPKPYQTLSLLLCVNLSEIQNIEIRRTINLPLNWNRILGPVYPNTSALVARMRYCQG